MKKNRPTGAVLVCGAGIAGIQASLDLANSGFKVYLLDSSPAIGGGMAQLDKTFPTGDCAMCTLSPKLVECARSKNIEIITLADIQDLSGEPGRFQVTVRKRPRFVDAKKCNACGDCTEVCPVLLPSEFDRALGKRKAIFRPYPQAIPNVFGISKAVGRAPCKAACPAGVNVQGYVALIAQGKIKEAYDVVRERCPLPAMCGRVCQHPCETKCNRHEVDQPLAVRDLKRFAADYVYANREKIKDSPPQPAVQHKEKVAIIGGGPAGLTAAADLRLMGYAVTIFDAKPLLGGMLRYGIPRYRLPEQVLDHEIQYILDLGIEAKTNTRVSDPARLLKAGGASGGNGHGEGKFDAVFVAVGAWVSRALGIPGEDAEGVWPGLKFLHEVNSGTSPRLGPNVLVIGGGDVAMDAARCARRGAGVKNVQLACLERREEMPAHEWESTEALEEFVSFHNSLGPTRILAEKGKVTGVAFRACTRVFDEQRRFSPQFDDSRTSTLAADTVIVTIGQGVDAASMAPLATGPGGRIVADPQTLATNIRGLYAGGDAVLGPASMVDAMAHGHRAAAAIAAYLSGLTRTAGVPPAPAAGETPAVQELAPNPEPDAPRVARHKMKQAPPRERVRSFCEIDQGYSYEEAVAEAKRCLACGLCSECGQCVKACSAGAIVHDMQPTTEKLNVGSIILTPGFEEFDPALRGEFGHGRYANVLSNLQFERLLSAAGPSSGEVLRPSDHKHPKSIAFIQCVGSRDKARGAGYCSSICCMAAAKEAMVALEHTPGIGVSIFCMDIRAFGKEFDQYVNRARDEQKVKFIRAIPSRIVELPRTKNLRLRYFDENGKEQQQEFDLVVLSLGLRPNAGAKGLAERLGLDLTEFGFCRTERFSPVAASRPGIYVAGVFQEPKDIPESVAQASAAASCAMEQLASARGSLIQRTEYPWEMDVSDQEPRIGVFICHCGHNIASVVDVNKVAQRAARMPNVVHAEASLYTCSDTNQQHIKDMIREHRLNRLVVASCSPRTHEILFQETLRDCGLNQYLFAMTNIRDQCSWVHREDPRAATRKAVDLMRMAVARARHLKALETGQLPVTRAALVIGGGLAGMTAALAVAEQGYEAHLVEKERELGGNLRQLFSTLENPDVQPHLAGLVRSVTSHPRIKLHLNSHVAEASGHVGNFKSQIKSPTGTTAVSHGVTIIATGGVERPTDKYQHGANPRVITQRELEALLHSQPAAGVAGLSPASAGGTPAPLGLEQLGPNPTVVMIQCVGSRTAEHPYCSRICCGEAVKNSLALKARLPGARIFVLAKDIRTYGFRELYFQKAREAGVVFIRYPEGKEPESGSNGTEIRVTDASTSRALTLRADLLVLSTGIAPAPDNPVLSGLLRTSLTADGFFLEAHPKLRPVDLASEGIFVCGLAHSPRFADETIAQARATAARAATILSKVHLEIPGQVSRVDPLKCIACMTCAKVCPYGAAGQNEDNHKAEIQAANCMGCGSCAAVCPAKAITLQHQEERTVVAMLDELLAVGGGAE